LPTPTIAILILAIDGSPPIGGYVWIDTKKETVR
jgi:hypothetical protein